MDNGTNTPPIKQEYPDEASLISNFEVKMECTDDDLVESVKEENIELEDHKIKTEEFTDDIPEEEDIKTETYEEPSIKWERGDEEKFENDPLEINNTKEKKYSKSSNLELSRKDVFFMVKDSLKNEQKFVIDVLKDAIFKTIGHVIQVDEDEKSLGLLFANFRSRWRAANRGHEKFLKNNEEWLKGTVQFSTSTSDKIVKNCRSGMERVILSKKDIFVMLRNNLFDDLNTVCRIVEEEIYKKFNTIVTFTTSDKQKISMMLHYFRKKWKECQRKEERFYKKYEDWLNYQVHFQFENEYDASDGHDTNCAVSSSRTKKRKVSALHDNHDIFELSHGTATGCKDAAKVVKDISENPSTPTKYLQNPKRTKEAEMTAEQALALLVDQKLTKSQYIGIRVNSLECGSKLYPSYRSVIKAKKDCYPRNLSDISLSETCAEIKLQSLLNLTSERLVLTQQDVLNNAALEGIEDLRLICKWGCDGTSTQNNFKQKFANGTETDAHIIFTSLVPLQLYAINDVTQEKVIVWKNSRPSSPRFCRPIKIEFLKETPETTRLDVEHIKGQEENLIPYETNINRKKISVKYELALTMIDGKVCNALTNTTSMQSCCICNATSKDFNDIDKVLQKETKIDNLSYSISSLHVWIRFFECCLHVSYRLDIKKWQARSDADKENVKSAKEKIQDDFRQKLGLIVDQPKQGFDSTNDGNTARRFFEKSLISASVTGFDLEMIRRFHVILQVISCGHDVNVEKFREYNIETARKFVELYPWCPMPPTVHKILIHGPEIVSSLLLPIGQLSEEAQESCNKFVKRCSRMSNIEDVFKRLLVVSDPLISNHRKLPQKKIRSLSAEAIHLLKEPISNDGNDSSSNSDSDSDDETA